MLNPILSTRHSRMSQGPGHALPLFFDPSRFERYVILDTRALTEQINERIDAIESRYLLPSAPGPRTVRTPMQTGYIFGLDAAFFIKMILELLLKSGSQYDLTEISDNLDSFFSGDEHYEHGEQLSGEFFAIAVDFTHPIANHICSLVNPYEIELAARSDYKWHVIMDLHAYQVLIGYGLSSPDRY